MIKVFLFCVALSAGSVPLVAQTQSVKNIEEQKSDEVRLKLTDGSFMAVDDAWQTPQGIWYRKGGLSYLARKDRVKSIERGPEPEPAPKKVRESNDGPLYMAPVVVPKPPPAKSENSVYEETAWIYLVGGARFKPIARSNRRPEFGTSAVQYNFY